MRGKHNMYMDGYLKENLDVISKMIRLKWDGICYISGYEGDGKTWMGATICYYMDPTITLDRVAFTSEQFMDCCLSAKPFEAILFDESYHSFSTKAIWNQSSRDLISMLTMIRKKQLFIVIVAPTFFDIQKYIAIHRSRFMIHVYSVGYERGFFEFYNRERKHQLYIKGKKDQNMKAAHANFNGRYTKFFPFDEEEYDIKKEDSIKALKKEQKNREDAVSPGELHKIKTKAQTEILSFLRSNDLLKQGTYVRLARYYDLSHRTIRERISACKIPIKDGEITPQLPELGD